MWVPAAQLDRLFAAFSQAGVDRILPWPGDRPWNFVLHDGIRRRVDLHLYEPRVDSSLHYGSAVADGAFPRGLTGEGTIAGTTARCETAEGAVRWAPVEYSVLITRTPSTARGAPEP